MIDIITVRSCSIDGCDKPARTRGWCSMHYRRWWVHGTTDTTGRIVNPDRGCSVEGCIGHHRSRGLCSTHWQRWYRHGDIGKRQGRPPQIGELARFKAKYLVSTNGCWLWQAGLGRGGYGKFKTDSGRTISAHKFSYESTIGPVPKGLQLDHLCRVHHCVNPSHLEPVTPKVNTYRGISVSAVNAAKKACIHGHAFTPENTRVYTVKGSNHRACKACRRRDANRRNQIRRTTGRRAA